MINTVYFLPKCFIVDYMYNVPFKNRKIPKPEALKFHFCGFHTIMISELFYGLMWKYVRSKKTFFTFFFYHIFHPHQLWHLTKNDWRFIQICAFYHKNSLLRIGKHKRCSLSIYHTSFDPHQLHYSIPTYICWRGKRNILHDLKLVCNLSVVFSSSLFYFA